MSLISEEQSNSRAGINLTPMIDFLFLMLAFFATLAVTRTSLFDTSLNLVQLNQENFGSKVYQQNDIYQINLSIAKNGKYKWITDANHYPMESVGHIQKEIIKQLRLGYIPEDKTKTKILIHIDRDAPWSTIADLLFSMKELGFDAHPVYKQEKH
jgi:biopolymer transport protein ExbD